MSDRPRNLDQLIGTHRLAAARRRAGLPQWRWKVPIKDLLSGEESNEVAQRVGREIAARLRRTLPGLFAKSDMFDDDLDDIVYDLDHGIETVDDFNDTLEALYDWADMNRLWLG